MKYFDTRDIPEDHITDAKASLQSVLRQLSPKELLVLTLRYGINGFGIQMAPGQIAETLGWPVKGVLEELKNAHNKVGSARSRQKLQTIFGRRLTPGTIAHQRRIK